METARLRTAVPGAAWQLQLTNRKSSALPSAGFVRRLDRKSELKCSPGHAILLDMTPTL